MRSSSDVRGSSILKSMPPEEVQIKRSRGELSCAECRRCRIRCDRKVPCGSCVRRGCVSLCPNGEFITGRMTRFVLADTEELHGQITQMSQRIRQLEDALSVAHSSDVHGDRHPLLHDELLGIKFGSGPRSVSEDNDDQFTLSFGTLAITDSGGSSYFGVSAGALVSHGDA
ncbi:hypothetical protein BDM02DRAFT_3100026 [Thelephora ganbajun]|uniref:Uncharacterized protein n=1 Tax=Thelephora ganbajun TaxID=370292 RepID=A0ACB6Z9Z3_THEGA|nr:hypothetical protein BDM02DRAFT_3100026 [Thelephora ganbajun]